MFAAKCDDILGVAGMYVFIQFPHASTQELLLIRRIELYLFKSCYHSSSFPDIRRVAVIMLVTPHSRLRSVHIIVFESMRNVFTMHLEFCFKKDTGSAGFQ